MDLTNFQIRSVGDADERTIEGIAAPYGQTIDAGDYFERFEPGAFTLGEDVKLYSEHDHLDKRAPIGIVTHGEDTEDGFVIRARISQTAKGEEVYQLLRDGVLKNFSVGFMPIEDRVEDDNTVVRTKVDLREVSVVAFPAYSAAQILAVRNVDSSNTNNNERSHNENTLMTTENINYATVADLDEVRNDIDRRLAIASEADKTDAPQFRSAGEWLKALSTGSDVAANEVRAYTGATSAKSHVGNDWKSDALLIVEQNRKVLNVFSRGPLGATGNTVEYPYVSATTGAVNSQVAEGDDLGYIETTVSTKTAPVLTYGAYSQLTRQAIERSDVSYLDAVLRQQLGEYAKKTNAVVRSALTGASAQAGAGFTLASATAADFLKAVVDGQQKIDALGFGLKADALVVSSDVYLQMAITNSANHFILDVQGDAGATIGSNNVQGVSATVAGVPVVVDAGLAAKSLYVVSSEAIGTWESAGAPVKLDDENIINLSKTFSLYGYMATGVKNASAIVKPAIA